jgi:hypothetical protein
MEGLYNFLTALMESHNYEEWERAKELYDFTDEDWSNLMRDLKPVSEEQLSLEFEQAML